MFILPISKLEDENLSLKEKHFLKRFYIKALKEFKQMEFNSRFPKDKNEKQKVYINTIKKHSLEKELEGYYLRGPFYELTKFDRINTYDENNLYFVKLDKLFGYLKKHIEIIDIINDADKNSTINTSYSNKENFTKPIINSYDNVLIDDKENKSLENKKSILEAYKEEPFIVSQMCQLANHQKNSIFFPEKDLLQDFKDMNNRIVSTKLKLQRKHIAKSLQAYIMNIYRNDSLSNQLLKDIPNIEDKSLVNICQDISKSFICNETSSPNVKNIYSKIKEIDLLNEITIYQPTTTPDKIGKINSYKDLLNIPYFSIDL